MKKYVSRAALACFVALATFAFVIGAPADPVPVSMTGMVMNQDLGQFNAGLTIDEFEQDGKKWKLKYEEGKLYSGAWMGTTDIFIEELEFDPDPIVYNNILVQNTTNITLIYQIDFTLPTTVSAPLQMRGSIDTSIIGTDTLLKAPMGGSVYTALIDGSPVNTLQDAPFALGTSQAATTSATNFDWVGVGGSVTSDIGIRLTFELSPGDYAAIISDFEVIPEPASLALIGLTVSGLVFVRRRFMD